MTNKENWYEAPKKCFVAMPFGDPDEEPTSYQLYQDAFIHIITAAASSRGYTVKRADQSPNPGIITAEIIRDLMVAELVIGDVTDANANVYYELGIRHAFKRPVVQICRQDCFPPKFDLAWVRTVAYGLQVSEAAKAIKDIEEIIDWMENNGFQGPVDMASAMIGNEQPGTQLLQEVVRSIEILSSNVLQQNSQTQQFDASFRKELEELKSSISDLQHRAERFERFVKRKIFKPDTLEDAVDYYDETIMWMRGFGMNSPIPAHFPRFLVTLYERSRSEPVIVSRLSKHEIEMINDMQRFGYGYISIDDGQVTITEDGMEILRRIARTVGFTKPLS